MKPLKIMLFIAFIFIGYITINYIKKNGFIDIFAGIFIFVSLTLLFALYNNIRTGVIQ